MFISRRKVYFEVRSVDILKPQRKLAKGDMSDRSEAVCRLILNGGVNVDYTFTGKDSNERCFSTGSSWRTLLILLSGALDIPIKIRF